MLFFCVSLILGYCQGFFNANCPVDADKREWVTKVHNIFEPRFRTKLYPTSDDKSKKKLYTLEIDIAIITATEVLD